jgi:hypothetical protein
MHINKGYVAPIILILVLLLLAGFFLFMENPSQEQNTPPILDLNSIQNPMPTPVEDEENATTTEDVEEDTASSTDEDVATSTQTGE